MTSKIMPQKEKRRALRSDVRKAVKTIEALLSNRAIEIIDGKLEYLNHLEPTALRANKITDRINRTATMQDIGGELNITIRFISRHG